MQTQIADSLNQLSGVRSEEAFNSILERSCHTLGFGRYNYFSINTEELAKNRLDDIFDDILCINNQRSNWIKHYVDQNYSKRDPVLVDAYRGRSPIIWNECYKRDTLTDDEKQVMGDAYDFGLERGISIPVHGPGGEFGMLALDSDIKQIEFEKLIDDKKHDLELLAYHAHAAAQAYLTLAETPKPTVLSEREIEVLLWTADGKTAWEIAMILNISERTVHFHIQKIMNKFGARNKTHALAKAMSFGMLYL